MSYAQAIFLSDDFSVAAIGALMEARTVATNKLYFYSAQFAGDTAQTLQDWQTRLPAPVPADAGPFVDGYGKQINGIGAPLRISVSRDSEGRVKNYAVVNADGTATAPPTRYTVDPNTGAVKFNAAGFGFGTIVGYIELRTIEGGALSQVQQDINSASAVIQTFSNLIAANKAALKSVLNVIR
ncbi:MAG: hypothetical protein H7338_24035 [Candidatus Sericytochromatia bacterium]|nr:hypothetical protein [Candidatus Sericytochromatia bacterium]